MKSYYCYVPKKGLLSPSDKVFKVSVGISEREQVKKTLVDCFACDCDLFFRIWDSTTDYELSMRVDPAFRTKFSVGLGFRVVHVSVSKLYDAIINGYVDTLEDAPNVAKNFFLLHSKLSPNFFFSNSSNPRKKSVPPFSRKNLSDGDVSEGLKASVGFVILFFLYWLGCLVRQLENAMF